jgi:hypothetical protein
MQAPEEPAILKGLINLLSEITRCQAADATAAAVAMIYICIDTMAFLAMPASQTTQGKNDFVSWVDTYLKTEPLQPYQYQGIDVYAARCGLLHAFSAEAEAHRKDSSVNICGYADNGPHLFNAAESTSLVIISVGLLMVDLGKAVDCFFSVCQTDLDLRARVEKRLPALYAAFPFKELSPQASREA